MDYSPTRFMLETSHYDKATADFAVSFIRSLRHTKGLWYNKPFELLEWQERIIRDIFGTLKPDGYRQFNTAYIEIPKKQGKQLFVKTPIPTPSGWSTMGDLEVGDQVIGTDGKPCTVVAKSEVDTKEDAYRLTFRDGSQIIAGARHQWMVDYIYGKTKPDVIMTSEEIYAKQEAIHEHYGDTADGLRSCIRIRMPEAMDLPEADLPVDPYLYGIWLGDGTASKPCICAFEDDMEYITEAIPYAPHNSYKNGSGRSWVFCYEELEPVLVDSWRDKVIRPEYLRASRSQRYALLAGLIDSDGHVSKYKGQTVYSGVCKPLIDSVRELLWSLGIKNNVTEEPCKYHGVETGETLYNIRFVSYDDMPVSRIPRYLERRIPRRDTRNGYHYLQSIEYILNGIPMQCIQVDSPDHCYLAGPSMVPTHNSELAAAVALFLLCADGEQRAEVYGCAADRLQAKIVFNVAVDMIKLCPALMKRCKIIESANRILFQPTNSFYQVLSAEVATKHGLNISGVVFDELHTQPNRKLFDVMTKGSGDARTQPLFFLITTAGDNQESICWEQHQKAVDILEGRKHDSTFYPVIYGADRDDDWTDPKVWYKANPSLGITVREETVRNACESAKQNPAEENSFRQLRLNQWVKQAVRWMPMEKWDKCDGKVDEMQLMKESLLGRKCYAGLDLSSTSDITALVLVFPPDDPNEGQYLVLPFFWIPEETVDLRVKRDHVPYDTWVQMGLVEVTEGNVIHYRHIEKKIEDLGKIYNIAEIAYDRWGATQMSQDLEEMGFTVVPFGQGFRDMSPPTKELMRLVLEGRIAHGGNRVLRWMMDNVYVRKDPADNIKMDKQKSTEKIDGAVAMVMALDRAIKRGGSKGESVYDTRDLIVF